MRSPGDGLKCSGADTFKGRFTMRTSVALTRTTPGNYRILLGVNGDEQEIMSLTDSVFTISLIIAGNVTRSTCIHCSAERLAASFHGPEMFKGGITGRKPRWWRILRMRVS